MSKIGTAVINYVAVVPFLIMIKNLFSDILKSFFSIGKGFALIVACSIFGFIIVFPLWKFATTLPFAYTIIVCTLFVAFIIYKIIKAIKKSPTKKTIKILLNIIIIAIGLVAIVSFVFANHRLFAIPFFILTPLLCIIVSNILKN